MVIFQKVRQMYKKKKHVHSLYNIQALKYPLKGPFIEPKMPWGRKLLILQKLDLA